MIETERLKRLKAALETVVIMTTEAEIHLEDAAELAELEYSDKAEKIWALKARLNRLGVEILELSKT